MPEIYISSDIETDGPIPGPHSSLSFGSATYLADKTRVSTFTANLKTLPGANGDTKTIHRAGDAVLQYAQRLPEFEDGATGSGNRWARVMATTRPSIAPATTW